MSSDSKFTCKNCALDIPSNALYCPHCGQKDSDGRVPVQQFISEFFDSVFNLDSRFFRTLKYIFFPAKLTKEYFKGKHKSYAHPLRLFFIIAVAHFAIIGIVANSNIGIEDTPHSRMDEQALRKEVYDLIDLFVASDSLDVFNAEDLNVLDSLKSFIRERGNIQIDTLSVMGFPSFNYDSLKIDIIEVKQSDTAQLTFDELVEKYNIEDRITKLWLRQQIKVAKDPKSLILFGIGNMIWMLFLLLPLVALFMKLLFIRRGYFFVEHLVFLYHWHAASFVFTTGYFLLMNTIHPGFIGAFAFVILSFGFMALRKYYGQGFFKSLLKYMVILLTYLVVFITLITFTSLISMLVF